MTHTSNALADPARELEVLMHEQIPITRAMGLRLRRCDDAGLVLAVPLAPNVNHEGTVFGGTQYSAAAAAGWALLHWQLAERGLSGHIVIYHGDITYREPMDGDFDLICPMPSAAELEAFAADFRGHGRARLDLAVRVGEAERPAVLFQGRYAVRSTA